MLFPSSYFFEYNKKSLTCQIKNCFIKNFKIKKISFKYLKKIACFFYIKYNTQQNYLAFL